jgi:hypothetical protein
MFHDFIHGAEAKVNLKLGSRQNQAGLQVLDSRNCSKRFVEFGLATGTGHARNAQKNTFVAFALIFPILYSRKQAFQLFWCSGQFFGRAAAI